MYTKSPLFLRRALPALGLSLSLVLPGAWAQTTPPVGDVVVDAQRITDADAFPGDWMTHGRTYTEQRFSPLDQINRDTVAGLSLAWSADIDTSRAQEATPIVVNGKIYVSTAWSNVKAFDALTGAPLWSWDAAVDRAVGDDVRILHDPGRRHRGRRG